MKRKSFVFLAVLLIVSLICQPAMAVSTTDSVYQFDQMGDIGIEQYSLPDTPDGNGATINFLGHANIYDLYNFSNVAFAGGLFTVPYPDEEYVISQSGNIVPSFDSLLSGVSYPVNVGLLSFVANPSNFLYTRTIMLSTNFDGTTWPDVFMFTPGESQTIRFQGLSDWFEFKNIDQSFGGFVGSLTKYAKLEYVEVIYHGKESTSNSDLNYVEQTDKIYNASISNVNGNSYTLSVPLRSPFYVYSIAISPYFSVDWQAVLNDCKSKIPGFMGKYFYVCSGVGSSDDLFIYGPSMGGISDNAELNDSINNLNNSINSGFSNMISSFQSGLANLANQTQQMTQQIVQSATEIGNKIQQQTTEILNDVRQQLGLLGDNIGQGLTNINNTITNSTNEIKQVFNQQTEKINNSITSQTEKMQSGFEDVKKGILELPGKIGEMLKGLIVPDQEKVGGKFDQVKNLAEEKLGILYQVPEMVIDMGKGVVSGVTTPKNTMTLPRFDIAVPNEGTFTVWEEYEFEIMPKELDVLKNAIKTITSLIVVIATINSIKRKYESWLNHQ